MNIVRTKGPSILRTPLYGDLDRRFIAFLIDSSCMVFLHSLLAYFWIGLPEQLEEGKGFLNFQVRHVLSNLSEFSNMALVALVFLLVQWLYFALMECSARQATIGKLAVGLKVTDLKGRPISFWRASARYFTKFLSLVPLGVGFMMAFYNRRKQSLHDLISSCLVLRA
ncbi:hypothetical protein BH24BAC1_BH24BAC1_18410 [soil metagenome]